MQPVRKYVFHNKIETKLKLLQNMKAIFYRAGRPEWVAMEVGDTCVFPSEISQQTNLQNLKL